MAIHWSPLSKSVFFGKCFFGCFFGGSVLVLLGLRSHMFIGAAFLSVGRRLKISGSVDVDVCVGGWCRFRGGPELSNCMVCHILHVTHLVETR